MSLRQRWPQRVEAVYPHVRNVSLALFALVVLGAIVSEAPTAIALELGIHNAALAIAVGASLATTVTIPAAVYASFMLFTGGTFAWAMSRRNVRSGETPAT